MARNTAKGISQGHQEISVRRERNLSIDAARLLRQYSTQLLERYRESAVCDRREEIIESFPDSVSLGIGERLEVFISLCVSKLASLCRVSEGWEYRACAFARVGRETSALSITK